MPVFHCFVWTLSYFDPYLCAQSSQFLCPLKQWAGQHVFVYPMIKLPREAPGKHLWVSSMELTDKVG